MDNVKRCHSSFIETREDIRCNYIPPLYPTVLFRPSFPVLSPIVDFLFFFFVDRYSSFFNLPRKYLCSLPRTHFLKHPRERSKSESRVKRAWRHKSDRGCLEAKRYILRDVYDKLFNKIYITRYINNI